MTTKLSVIIVNYRSSDALEHCLRSLHVATQSSLEIILVDNSPEDGAKEILQSSGFQGHYFSQPKNIGYTKAANFGARHATGELLCFVHPDILFEAGSLDRLMTWVEQHPQNIAGPRQRDDKDSIITSAFPLMSRRTVWGPSSHNGSPWPRSWQPYMSWLHPSLRYAEQNRLATLPEHVPALDSSCLVMTHEAWQQVGKFNEELQLVGLESEWFERAQELGLTAWYIPDAIVYHQRSTSINRTEAWEVKDMTNHDRRWYAKRLGIIAVVVLIMVLWFEHRLRPRDSR